MTLYKPEVYLPSSCTWVKDGAGNPVAANTVSFTCRVAHMPSGATFPAFFAFYTAPTKVVNGSADGPNTDFVSTDVLIVYAEGTNDQPNSVPTNSVIDKPQANLVLLGTSNPTNVKSGVSKDGVLLATGNNAIPTAATYPFASSLNVPPLPTSTAPTKAEILLSPDDDAQLCQNAGNFSHCYQAAVTVLNVSYVGTSSVMTLLLRIDGAEVINPFRAANVHIYHDGAEVFACQAGQPDAVTTACVQSISRYSNAASNGDLRQDVEVRVLTLKNGSWGMR
jgi:hypothetical protein